MHLKESIAAVMILLRIIGVGCAAKKMKNN